MLALSEKSFFTLSLSSAVVFVLVLNILSSHKNYSNSFSSTSFSSVSNLKRKMSVAQLQEGRPDGKDGTPGVEGPRKYLIGGNWKCNGTWDENKDRVEMFNALDTIPGNVEVVLCVPDMNIPQMLMGLRKDIAVGGQNCGVNKGNGAFTGETGSHQLKDIGCTWVIVGHSERREGFGMAGENVDLCAEKCKVAIDNGLKVMFAIGEKKEEREGGTTMDVCASQLAPLAKILDAKDWDEVAIAYEPVWAIGTGLTATPEMAQETHKNIRDWVVTNVSPEIAAAVRIQYGGSMKGANAKDLLEQPDIDGGLIGGASLKDDFFNVINGIPK